MTTSEFPNIGSFDETPWEKREAAIVALAAHDYIPRPMILLPRRGEKAFGWMPLIRRIRE